VFGGGILDVLQSLRATVDILLKTISFMFQSRKAIRNLSTCQMTLKILGGDARQTLVVTIACLVHQLGVHWAALAEIIREEGSLMRFLRDLALFDGVTSEAALLPQLSTARDVVLLHVCPFR